MTTVRLGIIGVGSMGAFHLRNLLDKKVQRVTVTAVCDIDPAKLAAYPDCAHFTDSAALIRAGVVDAVLVVTPHYAHTTIGIDALQNGLHVLVEKPISVHVADAQKLIAAHTSPTQVFAAMFNQRTDPHYAKVRALIQQGELGELRRVNWLITNWFRTQAYYNSSAWRATWGGEGGGVLLNQCPHNLDLLQWLCGMPAKVRAHCFFGKYHAIEVEDDVTAYLEYANGATGLFVTTTGETPGTNRLEITGDRGKVVVENGTITFHRTVASVKNFCMSDPSLFGTPEVWQVQIPAHDSGGQHVEILQNFVNAILDGTPLVAPAEEGIHSVTLANAMLYSAFTDRTVTLPLDAAAYARKLQELIATSTLTKAAAPKAAADLAGSFNKA
ncbi:MAG: Gfo/Idh/MocA family oxidoreductase [bacterium]|nr:Gfo/Idh/MocA family oxidoreductase [bacterium]